jgi:hypothetical protein
MPIQPQPIPAELLKNLSPLELRILQIVLRNHPMLTPEKALRQLREAGM